MPTYQHEITHCEEIELNGSQPGRLDILRRSRQRRYRGQWSDRHADLHHQCNVKSAVGSFTIAAAAGTLAAASYNLKQVYNTVTITKTNQTLTPFKASVPELERRVRRQSHSVLKSVPRRSIF